MYYKVINGVIEETSSFLQDGFVDDNDQTVRQLLIADLIKSTIKKLIDIAEFKIESGAVVFNSKSYGTSDKMSLRIHGLHTLAGLGKGPINRKIMDKTGTRNALTQNQLEDLGSAISIYQDSIYSILEIKIAEVKTMTLLQLNSYDINQGWPQ